MAPFAGAGTSAKRAPKVLSSFNVRIDIFYTILAKGSITGHLLPGFVVIEVRNDTLYFI